MRYVLKSVRFRTVLRRLVLLGLAWCLYALAVIRLGWVAGTPPRAVVPRADAAVVLGASAWQMFWRVTLPKIKWGLLYGVILCNARAMGEFGAVSVVSGHIRGRTNTIPLHVEILYNEYNFQAAFAVASLLALLALITLAVKGYIEWRFQESEVPAAEDEGAAVSARG